MNYSPYIEKQLEHKETGELFKCVFDIAKRVDPKNTLEIGVAWAITTIAILSASETQLLSIDKGHYQNTEDQVAWHGFGPRWQYIIEASQSFLAYHTGRYELIVIDGSHYYEDVKSDLNNSLSLLAPGGSIVVDDYSHKYNVDGDYGVTQAVNEFVTKNKLEMKLHKYAHGIVEITNP